MRATCMMLLFAAACQNGPQPEPDGGTKRPDAGLPPVTWKTVSHGYTVAQGHCEARWQSDLSGALGEPGRVMKLDDVTGDGVADLLVSGVKASAEGGLGVSRVSVLSGVTGRLAGPLRELRGALMGTALSADIDGDGARDLVVATLESPDLCGGGSAPSSGCNDPRTHLYALKASSFEATWSRGPTPGAEQLGVELAGWVDENGDGVPDVLAGAPFPKAGAAGVVQVLSGKTGERLRTLETAQGADSFGARLARAPDLDGDGTADLWVSDVRGPAEHYGAGAVFALSGKTGEVLWRHDGEGGENPDLFGEPLEVLGDLDGDGVPELAVGAPNHAVNGVGADTGAVTVLSGKSGAPLRQVDGAKAGDRFGTVLASAGDLDGDGKPDFVVAEPGSVGSFFEAPRAGRVRVFSGATAAVLVELGSSAPTDVSDRFGATVLGLGDLDGDGRAELLVGAPGSKAVGAAGTAELTLFSCKP
ncbi:MAG: VCBS repeat-containing protein [Archangiaceae bacterium]|nr:VCBS repeat-containing protein [Archangiaceae bacterium]